ncbi:MAG: hypothetical protein M3264_15295, partial [Thermoproteota archaeon]|nr:hypothetical protein [Thermoproteota archaeon]
MHRSQVVNAIVDIFYNAEDKIYICGNSQFPELIFSFEPIRKAILAAKNRGTRQKYIVEISRENIQYCKKLI